MVLEEFRQRGNGLGRTGQLIEREGEVVAEVGIGPEQVTDILHTETNFRQRYAGPRQRVGESISQRVHTIAQFFRQPVF